MVASDNMPRKEVKKEGTPDYSSYVLEDTRTPEQRNTKRSYGEFYSGVLRIVKERMDKEGKDSYQIKLKEGMQPKSIYYGFYNEIKGSTYETLGFKASLRKDESGNYQLFIIQEKEKD